MPRKRERRKKTLQDQTGSETPMTVLYDGECTICRASVRRLKSWTPPGDLEFIPTQDPSVPIRFFWLSPDALDGSLHLVGKSGETWEGASAVEEIVRALPRFRMGAWVFRIPLVRPLARKLYTLVARNRYRWSCGRHCR